MGKSKMKAQLVEVPKMIQEIHQPRRANECMKQAKDFMPPQSLFDEFWREGELALLFGAHGTGKSMLAVQIADALARGRPMAGFGMPSRRRKVLYVDMMQQDVQFQMRYSQIDGGGTAKTYRFAENLYRGRPISVDGLVESLRKSIKENGFRVIVIDDLSALKRTHDGTRETLTLMRSLRELRDELNVSILVLADSEEPRRGSVVGEADLRRSRILGSVADSVFAIGRLPHDAGDGRYLVQTRSLCSRLFWTACNAPRAVITRHESGLLGFEFDDRFTERPDEEELQLIRRVASMRSAGATYRAIAAELGFSKSRAERLSKRWTPAVGLDDVINGKNDDRAKDSDQDNAERDNLESPSSELVSLALPGEAYRGEFTDRYLVSLGMRPLWKEKWENRSEPQTALQPEEGRHRDGDGVVRERSGAQIVAGNGGGVRTSARTGSTIDAAGSGSAGPARRSIYDLKRGLDGYGGEIFIESEEHHTGRPIIWYELDENGNIVRRERKLYTISTEHLGPGPYLL